MDGSNLANGGNISGVTNSQLTIGPAVLADAGTYSVVVANAFGSATSAVATLTIPAPTLSITPPPAHVAQAALTVAGKASGAFGIANVQYQLNGGAWSPAASASQWTNWTALVTLQPGSNVFRAYSVDPVGNHSVTNSAAIFYVTRSPLILLVNGFGTISHSFLGTNLIVGHQLYRHRFAQAKQSVLQLDREHQRHQQSADLPDGVQHDADRQFCDEFLPARRRNL